MSAGAVQKVLLFPTCPLQTVEQKSIKIGEEEIKCQHMADLAQHDLDEAMPALEAAMKVIQCR